jgi:hypothetical protein
MDNILVILIFAMLRKKFIHLTFLTFYALSVIVRALFFGADMGSLYANTGTCLLLHVI